MIHCWKLRLRPSQRCVINSRHKCLLSLSWGCGRPGEGKSGLAYLLSCSSPLFICVYKLLPSSHLSHHTCTLHSSSITSQSPIQIPITQSTHYSQHGLHSFVGLSVHFRHLVAIANELPAISARSSLPSFSLLSESSLSEVAMQTFSSTFY